MIPGRYEHDQQTNESVWVPAHWEQGNTSYGSQEEEQKASEKLKSEQEAAALKNFKPDESSWSSKYIDPKSVYINGYEQKATGTYRTDQNGEPEAVTEDDLSRPIYAGTLNINGQKFIGTFNADGKFAGATGERIDNNFQQWLTPEGNLTALKISDPGMSIGDFAKMIAPLAINLAFPGAGAAIGGALGAGATWAPVVGGAVMGGGLAGLTGGNILQGAVMGGLGGANNVGIGSTGITVGDALKGVRAAQALGSGNILGALSSIASMSGVGNIKIGDTGFTINEAAKDINIANALIKGNLPAFLNTMSAIAKASNNTATSVLNSDKPLSKDDLESLDPDQRAAYDAKGTAGLKAYNEQQKANSWVDENTSQNEIDRLIALHPAQQTEQPTVEQPPSGGLPPVETVHVGSNVPNQNVDLSNATPSPTGGLPTSSTPAIETVNVTAPSDKLVDLTDQTPPTRSLTPSTQTPPLGTIRVTAPKCEPGYHFDEEVGACVPDEAALPPVQTTTQPTPTNPKDPVVPDEIVITATKNPIDLSTVNDATVTTTPLTPPAITQTPVATTKTPTTSSSKSSSGSGSSYADMKLNEYEKFLKGIYSPEKLAHLASLHQLFKSLTPDMQEVLAAKNIVPPSMLDSGSSPQENSTMNEKDYATVFSASGGSIASDMAKMINDMNPKYERAPTMLAAAPVNQSPSPLGTLKHIRQGPLKGAGLSGGLAHGGLPHKYAEAAPKGHNPEFITGVTGYYAQGGGTGQSDDIPAMLHDGDFVMDADTVAALGDGSSKAGAEVLEKMRTSLPHHNTPGTGHPVPAQIADGEYVFPAAFVTAIGGGSNKLGAKRLNEMREKIRAHKRSAPDSKIPPKAKSPLDYLKMAKG
jgi:hypothetical protein